MEQMSDLFVEHHYFKFQDEIQFFHITTMEHRNIAIQKAYVVATCNRPTNYFSKSCIISLAWWVFANVMVLYYFYLFV